jgi:hypothetical protein
MRGFRRGTEREVGGARARWLEEERREMKKSAIVVSLGIAALTSTAFGDSSNAGRKGYVAAYEADGSTVIEVKKCNAKGSTWDYVGCGKAFREEMKTALCASRGKGNHKWLYRVGDSKSKVSNTARCK